MNKIAKSIKRLRTTRNLSQEDLAEKLFVSRQAISSWENNRTQPDIEMIGKLSEIFEVSIEELIYGEKRKVEIDNEDTPRLNKNLIIVFSVLGSIFVGLSLIFFLFIGWQSFGIVTKSVLSFLPLLAGQGIALFTYFKKFDKVSWRESSAILWCIGVISTFALINGIFNINLSETIFLTAVCLIILPVIYIFDVVSPLIPYFLLSLYFNLIVSYPHHITGLVLSTIFVGAGVLFTILSRRKDNSPRKQFGIIVSLFSLIGLLFFYTIAKDGIAMFENTSYYALFLSYFTGLIAYGRADRKAFNTIGALGLTVSMLLLSFSITPKFDHLGIFTTEHSIKSVIGLVILWLVNIGIIAFGFLTYNEPFTKDKIKLLKCISGIAITFLTFIFCDEIPAISIVIAMLTAVLFMLSGTRDNNFIDFNIGLISLLFCLVRIIIIFSDDILILAFILLISGVCLLVTNLALLKKVKKENKPETLTDGGDGYVQK